MNYGHWLVDEAARPYWDEACAVRQLVSEERGYDMPLFGGPLDSEMNNNMAGIAERHVITLLGGDFVEVLPGPDEGFDGVDAIPFKGGAFTVDAKWTHIESKRSPHLLVKPKDILADVFVLVCGGVTGDVSAMQAVGWMPSMFPRGYVSTALWRRDPYIFHDWWRCRFADLLSMESLLDLAVAPRARRMDR